MEFVAHLRDISKGFLERGEGCDEFSFNALIKTIRFFQYDTLAEWIILNSKCFNGKYKCKVGILDELFREWI